MSTTHHSARSLLQGTAILSLGALAAKCCGALFRIPLSRLLTPEGAAHFHTAYNLYLTVLNLACAGLPSAVSRLVSSRLALGASPRTVHQVSLRLFTWIGLIGSGLLLFGAEPLALWLRDPDAACAIRVLSPAVLFVCIGGAYRGWFQGHQNMVPTASAQIIEALCKLILGLIGASLALRAGADRPEAAGAAMWGVSVGTMLSWLCFVIRFRRSAPEPDPESPSLPIIKELLRLAVPITVGAVGMQLFQTLSGRVILMRLQDELGLSPARSAELYGIYAMALSLYLLPAALIQPLTVSILPAVSEALARGQLREAGKREEAALALCCLIAVPAGFGLGLLSRPIQQLLYGYDARTLAIAGPVLSILGIASICHCLVLVLNAILQARGRPGAVALSSLSGTCVGLSVTWLLTSIPQLNVIGGALGTLTCCAAMLIVDAAFFHKHKGGTPMRIPVRILLALNTLFPPVEHPFNLQNEGRQTYAQWQYQWGEKTVECFSPGFRPGDIFAGKRVLDMGCGASGKSLYYLSIGASSVVGVDIVPRYKPEAEAFARELGFSDRFTFLLGDALHLPLEESSFDVVIMNDFMEHIYDPEGAILEAMRVLKPGGRLFVNFPPYFHPTGAHLSDLIGIPWGHMLFSERTLIESYRELARGLPDEQERLSLRFGTDERGRERISYINKMTIRRFRRMCKRMDLMPLWYREIPLRSFLSPLARVPVLKEMFVKMCACVIEKP